MTSPHRINGGSGPEIVPTSREFPLWVRDLALALLFVTGLVSFSFLLDRWELVYAEQERLQKTVATCKGAR